MDKSTNNIVLLWWFLITIVSIFNISFITNYLIRYNLNLDQKKVIILALIYTIVCGLRSFYPKNDIVQNCLFKSKLSHPFFGRSIATVAEMSLIILVVFIFKRILNDFNLGNTILAKNVLPKLVPLIGLAQLCCWSGCLTKNYLYNATEETIWLITFTVILYLMIILKIKIPNNNPKGIMIQQLLTVGIPFVLTYLIFLASNDIPMYLNKWNKNKNNIRNCSIIENINSFNKCNSYSWSLNDWKKEIPWQTGYFTFGVWSAIGISLWFNKYLEI